MFDLDEITEFELENYTQIPEENIPEQWAAFYEGY